MTLQRRFALVAAVAVAVAIALASGLVYIVVRGELRGRLDDGLRSTVTARLPFFVGRAGVPTDVGRGGPGLATPVAPGAFQPRGDSGRRDGAPSGLAPPRDALGLQTAYLTVVGSDGRVRVPPGGRTRLPVSAATRAVAAGARKPFFSDASVGGADVRVYTSALPGLPGLAIQVARPLAEVNRTLDRLALVLALVSAAGIALAAGLGRLVARTALAPVGRLTAAVEHVAQTSDLSRRIDATGEDEIGRLARSFNGMLAALESSVGRQRQLVADASHELRTPLTSLRTNIEVLARSPVLPEDERSRLLADVIEQLDELGGLVGDVVELAREEERAADAEEIRFDELVEAAVARARRRAGAPMFAAALEPCLVRGVPARLDRAVANLLDNAAKWGPAGGEVTVALRDGELTVRDRGPGIAASDLPHVFERFYRAPGARGTPGSGLGLAIVRQVAELHGGSVEARAAEGGGALLALTLPAERPPCDGEPAIVPRLDTVSI
jgi:two-component system sensor histidine kinase MprB